MHSILSNQRLINEINSIKDDFIQSRPHMQMSVFKATRKSDGRSNKYDNAERPKFFKDDRGGGSPSFQKHPLSYAPPGGSTATTDPLFSGVVTRPVPKGGAMLKAPLPLTGEDSDSDYEGAGVLNGYSSSDDEDDYDDGAGLVDDAKEAIRRIPSNIKSAANYVKGKIPSKAELEKVSKDIYKMVTSKEAQSLGVNALKVAIAAYVVTKLGPYGAPVVAAANKTIDEVLSHVKGDSKGSYEQVPKAAGGKIKRLVAPRGSLPEGLREAQKKSDPKIVGKKRGERVRGDVVAEVMRKQGLSLGAASKYVKEHNLY